MCRMNPNGSTRAIRNDPKFQTGYAAKYSEIGPELKRDGFLVGVCGNPMNSVLRLYLTATTGQGASRMTYWAVEPNTNLPTFDLLLTPIMISSILLSLA